MVPSIRRTADLVQEVAAASNEQARTVIEINKAMGQVDEVTQRTAAAAEELSATAEEMSAQAESLQQLVAFFREDTRPPSGSPASPPSGNGHGAFPRSPARSGSSTAAPAGAGDGFAPF
jgi:methyl-accepting chemotaxis protein